MPRARTEAELETFLQRKREATKKWREQHPEYNRSKKAELRAWQKQLNHLTQERAPCPNSHVNK